MTTFNNDFLTHLARDGGTLAAPVGFKINDVEIERGDKVQFIGTLNGYSLAAYTKAVSDYSGVRGWIAENTGLVDVPTKEIIDVNNDGKADEIFYHGGLAYAKLGA